MDSPFTLGGEQRVVSVLANYLYKNNYDIYFLLTDPNNLIDYNIYNLNKNIKIIFLKKYNTKFRILIRKILNKTRGIISKTLILQKQFYCNIFDKKIIIDELNNNYFDYIIGVASKYYGILSVVKPKLINTKIIAWQHSTYEAYFETENRRFYNQKKFVEYMFKNIDQYICQTQDDYEKIYNKFNYKSAIINNPNTFSNNKISNLNNNNFLALGRFVKMKGFDKLIDAFNIFAQNNKDWKLYIVGDGPEKNNYIKKIKEYQLEDRIILPGKTDNVESYYLNSTIYLMSSLWEGWGMVITEAMQYGLVVISFDLPSSKEIFGEKECGILVKKYNVEKYAQAMLKLVENEDLIKKYSSNSKEQVKRFRIETIGKKWEEILK